MNKLAKYLPVKFNGNESFIKSCICMSEFLCTLTRLHLFQLVFTYGRDVQTPKLHQVQPKLGSWNVSVIHYQAFTQNRHFNAASANATIIYLLLYSLSLVALECGGSAFRVQLVPQLMLKFNNNLSIGPGGSIGGVLKPSNSSYNLFRLGKALSP